MILYQIALMTGDWIINSEDIQSNSYDVVIDHLEKFYNNHYLENDNTIAYLDNELTLYSLDQIPLAMYCEVGLITDRVLMSKIIQRSHQK